MASRKIESKTRYLYAFIITTIFFVFVFLISYLIAYLEFQRVAGLQGPLSYKIFQKRIIYELVGSDICDSKAYEEVSNELFNQALIIADLERKLGLENPDVLFRKKFFSVVQMEHFSFVKKIGKECNRSINTILFFYSNDKKWLEKSEEIGRTLSVIYERNKGNLMVYSLDVNLDSELIEKLKEKYNVKDKPIVILNEKYRFSEIDDIKDIESLLSR